jgi:hypothetical protein
MKLLALIFFIVLFIYNSILQLYASDIVKTIEADLNGDNKPDKISLSLKVESGEFILRINNASINGSIYIESPDNLDEEIGLKIVDIDKRDKYKEIEVFYNGERYDLTAYHLFTFNGNLINKLLDPVSIRPAYSGYGIVLIDKFCENFWTKKEKYILNRETRKLELVPQEFYYVGVEASVKEMFPIYQTRAGKDVVANLRPSSTCMILVCDPEGWYLIKSVSGLVGWTKDLSKLQLPSAG